MLNNQFKIKAYIFYATIFTSLKKNTAFEWKRLTNKNFANKWKYRDSKHLIKKKLIHKWIKEEKSKKRNY